MGHCFKCTTGTARLNAKCSPTKYVCTEGQLLNATCTQHCALSSPPILRPSLIRSIDTHTQDASSSRSPQRPHAVDSNYSNMAARFLNRLAGAGTAIGLGGFLVQECIYDGACIAHNE